jgi:hypothetical protein
LKGIPYRLISADDLAGDSLDLAGFNLGPLLFFVLLAVLAIEQALAYFSSYHTSRRMI